MPEPRKKAAKKPPGKAVGKPTPPPGKKAAATKTVAKVVEPKPISEEVLQRYADVFEIRKHFDQTTLKAVCEAHETTFEDEYGMTRVEVAQKEPSNYYYYRDNGSNILAVAHLDTVVSHERRMTDFAETAEGLVVHSGALDDRLGAYIILELLPSLGLEFDWLLTVGEEKGQSTASFFDPPEGKEYNWGIEFDRGGKDVVMYCYDDFATDRLVKDSGARTARGSFSDIAYLEHLEVKMFNWGVAYQDYHTTRGYAYLEDTFEMLAYFRRFHRLNADEYLPHEKKKYNAKGRDNKTKTWPSSTPSAYGYWENNQWIRYTDEEKAKRKKEAEAAQHWTGGGNRKPDDPMGKGGGRKTESEKDRDKEVEEWWRTQDDSLYGGYELYEPQKSLGGHEELDEETQAILVRLTEDFESDVPYDIDTENPLGIDLARLLGGDYDEDPDFVGPLPLEQRRTSIAEVGGWPTDD